MNYLSEDKMITKCAKEFKINVLQNELEDFITLATQENWEYRTLIARILEKEEEIRVEKRRKQQVRIAGFSQMKYLQELIREEFPKDAQMAISELETLDFIKEGEGLLLNHLSLRAGKKATIITTNLSFDRWGEIVKDKVLVAAMVDRLTHKAHLINMTGQSYRVKETQNMRRKIAGK